MPELDKGEYRRRRSEGLRGRGDLTKPTIYPKGTTVLKYSPDGNKIMRYEHGELVEATVPNALGRHMVTIRGKLTYQNRSESRRRQVSRLFTKHGFKPDVNPPKFQHPGTMLSNHQRNLVRKVEREQRIYA